MSIVHLLTFDSNFHNGNFVKKTKITNEWADLQKELDNINYIKNTFKILKRNSLLKKTFNLLKPKLLKFKTDIGYGGNGGGHKGPYYNKNLKQMLEIAKNMNANIVCKTTVGSWYIKNTSLKIPYNDILKFLKKNTLENFKPKCRTWIIN
jgi:hypothetical protein